MLVKELVRLLLREDQEARAFVRRDDVSPFDYPYGETASVFKEDLLVNGDDIALDRGENPDEHQSREKGVVITAS